MSIGGLPALNDGNNDARGALQPPDRGQQRPDVLLRGQRRPRGRTRSATRPSSSKAMAVGAYITKEDLAAELRLRRQLPGQPPSVQLERPGRGRRVQAEHRRARRGDLLDADVAERRTRRRDVHAPAGLRDDERHLDGLTAGHRRRRAADQRSEAAAPRPSSRRRMFWHARAAADGDELDGPLPPRLQRVRSGQRPDRRRTRRGVCSRRTSSP